MEKEQLTTVPDTTENTEAIDKDNVNSLGKFKTKEDLLEAYNSLEAEFTRRSQKLKELEQAAKQRETDGKWIKKVNALHAEYPVAKELSTEISEFLENRKDLLNDENCLEKALLSVLAKGYKKADSAEKKGGEIFFPEISVSGGEIPVVLPVRPKTIAEAGELVRKIIKNI